MKSTLRPDVNVFVEYSNEVWHTGFITGQYAQQQGLMLNMTEQGSAWYGGAANEARLCFAGNRTRAISQIWKEEFGAEASRVKVVVSSQFVWPLVSDKLLSCGATYQHVDYLALGPYFGDPSLFATAGLTLDAVFNTHLPAAIQAQTTYLQQHKAYATARGVGLITYESGFGGTGDGTSNDLAIQVCAVQLCCILDDCVPLWADLLWAVG